MNDVYDTFGVKPLKGLTVKVFFPLQWSYCVVRTGGLRGGSGVWESVQEPASLLWFISVSSIQHSGTSRTGSVSASSKGDPPTHTTSGFLALPSDFSDVSCWFNVWSQPVQATPEPKEEKVKSTQDKKSSKRPKKKSEAQQKLENRSGDLLKNLHPL